MSARPLYIYFFEVVIIILGTPLYIYSRSYIFGHHGGERPDHSTFFIRGRNNFDKCRLSCPELDGGERGRPLYIYFFELIYFFEVVIILGEMEVA